eukprot:s3587_g2.t1
MHPSGLYVAPVLAIDVGHCAIMLVCCQCPVGILRCLSNYFDWTWIDWITVVRLLVQGYSWSKELLASADLFCASGDLLWMYCRFQKEYLRVAVCATLFLVEPNCSGEPVLLFVSTVTYTRNSEGFAPYTASMI